MPIHMSYLTRNILAKFRSYVSLTFLSDKQYLRLTSNSEKTSSKQLQLQNRVATCNVAIIQVTNRLNARAHGGLVSRMIYLRNMHMRLLKCLHFKPTSETELVLNSTILFLYLLPENFGLGEILMIIFLFESSMMMVSISIRFLKSFFLLKF